jgi:glycosyltransferase involved in cell wall biosynthesis
VSAKPRIQVFLKNLKDEKAVEAARWMPFLKRDFKVGITYISDADTGEGVFADSGLPLTAVEIPPLPPDDLISHLEAFSQAIKEDTPDAVLASIPGPESAAFLIAARAAGVSVVLAHFDDQPSLISTLEELSALYMSDLVLPATRNLQREIIRALPTLSDRIGHLLPHSADTTYIQLTKEDRQRLRQKLGVDQEAKMITMIAPFDRRRDHDTLIDACQLLKKRGHDFILLLVGDGPERNRIAEKICFLELHDRVAMMDDLGDHLDILCATDIFALISHFEGNNVPLLEAMAQGLALAGTDVNGINDLIRDERSGKLSKPGDAESLTEALHYLLAQEKTRKKLGSVARKSVENRCNLNQFMPVLVKTLKTRLKEFFPDAKTGRKAKSRNGHLGRQYLKLQKEIRTLWTSPAANFGIQQAADMLDGFPLHTQVDLLEKLCEVRAEPGPLALFIRPLEKVLADRFYEHIPLLEMRLMDKLAAFYIELAYGEGARKLIERIEASARQHLFRYQFACNRFSGLRAQARLSQLYGFTGEVEKREFYRLEMWEYMRPRTEAQEAWFHQQNAVFLEALGELRLAARELQKDTMGTIPVLPGLPVAYPIPDLEPEMPARRLKSPAHKAPRRQAETIAEVVEK